MSLQIHPTTRPVSAYPAPAQTQLSDRDIEMQTRQSVVDASTQTSTPRNVTHPRQGLRAPQNDRVAQEGRKEVVRAAVPIALGLASAATGSILLGIDAYDPAFLGAGVALVGGGFASLITGLVFAGRVGAEPSSSRSTGTTHRNLALTNLNNTLAAAQIVTSSAQV